MIDELQTKHMHDNLEQYVQNSLSASARRVLITKWVGAAWSQVSQKKENQFQSMEVKMLLSISVDLKNTPSAAQSLNPSQKRKTCLSLIPLMMNPPDCFELSDPWLHACTLV